MLIRSTFSTYSAAAHDDVLQQWDAVRHEKGPLDLDLSRLRFIDPYGMCGLVLFLNHLPEEATPVSLRLDGWPLAEAPVQERKPNAITGAKVHIRSAPVVPSSGPISYLTRMGFWDLVCPQLDVKPSQVPITPNNVIDRNVLLDLTILHSHDAISVMLRQTGEILQNLNYTVPARGHILEVLSELCSNVLLHAQTEFGGVAAIQTYKNRSGERYIVLSIGDAGIGVRRSLAANQALSDRLQSDAQALGVAVQPGASRFASGGHGGGLPRVMEIARRYGGRVVFRSGQGALAFHGGIDEKRIFEAPPLAGTQLRISLPETKLRAAQGTGGFWKPKT